MGIFQLPATYTFTLNSINAIKGVFGKGRGNGMWGLSSLYGWAVKEGV